MTLESNKSVKEILTISKILWKYYEVSFNLKINLAWNYDNDKVHLSMVPYLDKALHQFHIIPPSKWQDAPYLHIPPKFGAKMQYTEVDNSPPAGKEAQTHVHKINGNFFHMIGLSMEWCQMLSVH